MKKLLLAVAFLFFAGFTHADTLQGNITDFINDVNLNEERIIVSVNDTTPPTTKISDANGYKFRNINLRDNLVLTLKKEGFEDFAGHFVKMPDDSYMFSPTQGSEFGSLVVNEDNICNDDESCSTEIAYTLDLKMIPTKEEDPIFAGIVYTTDADGANKEVAKDVQITIYGKHSDYFNVNGNTFKTNEQGKFAVKGYKFTEKNNCDFSTKTQYDICFDIFL